MPNFNMSFPGSYRESIPQEIRPFWIPAYAGMTAQCDKKAKYHCSLALYLLFTVYTKASTSAMVW